ncbi:MAG: dihydrodipicolinate synthase family protein [Chlamydiota bacterium]
MASNVENTPSKLPCGVYAAVLTPLREDLSCDVDALAEHSLDVISRGCQGIVVLGTTGEGASFSTQERIETLGALIARGVDPKKILLANGGASIPDTVELTREGLRHGCPAMLVCPPTFFKGVSEKGVLEYYREVIQRVDNPQLKVFLYHIPQLSGVPITLRIIEVLKAEFPDVVIGIKESEGNWPFTVQILEQFPGFQVFVGNEGHITEAVSRGASGAICGMANLYPELICSLLKHPSPQLEPFFQAIQGLHFISAFKALLAQKRGEKWLRVRPPLVPLDKSHRDTLLSREAAIGIS